MRTAGWMRRHHHTRPARRKCIVHQKKAVTQAFLTAAKTACQAHEKATGFPSDALVSYIQAAQHRAGCPAKAG